MDHPSVQSCREGRKRIDKEGVSRRIKGCAGPLDRKRTPRLIIIKVILKLLSGAGWGEGGLGVGEGVCGDGGGGGGEVFIFKLGGVI